ncbi:TonB C-terminal domain-containing protein [Geobacter pickeringii]|uniref:Energy transducer TonB n=1 Tax=Geobacter pickeringii TaxID=345632 RepID=A0A0B5BI93_9BACT|nr:TonB C-terminal domain-containing protein [Geobacter pickeringii]AJE04854.1 energy transducer TonB [Geobacter pickeringii]
MATKKHKKQKLVAAWVVPGMVVVVLAGLVGFVVKVMLSDDGPRRQEKMTSVTLVKPPPEQPKEKPPEPEMPKEVPKQTIETPIDTPQQAAQPNQSADPGPPAGADLGVDADGGAGGDGFGLVGRKGGRAITLGGGGGGGGPSRLSLLSKYGWYSRKVQDEIKYKVRKQLEQDGVHKGKFEAVVRIVLDGGGTVVKYQILTPSGNDKMDSAVRTILGQIRVSEPPPEGMPKGMTFRISSQG